MFMKMVSNLVCHSHHLVDESPWPLIGAMGGFFTTTGLIKWFHQHSSFLLLLGVLLILMVMVQWWRDVAYEGAFQGLHSGNVELGLRWGMALFIVSEVFFFLSFFWAFFHSSLAPGIELGSSWPPAGVLPFNFFMIPLLNTVVLLSSGVSVTWAHHAIMENKHTQACMGLLLTSVLGLYFTALQGFEYYEATFSLAESVYGSLFFVATGFHGLHVIIGTTFLLVCLKRLTANHYSKTHHFGLEAAAWYWHFVDVVWLFLYIWIYWWGGAY